jgi:hypothetical protein
MNSNQSAILSYLLELSNEVIANDVNDMEIQTNISAINAITSSDSSYSDLISDNVKNMISASSAANADILTTIINGLTTLASDQPVILGMLAMHNLRDPQKIASYIDTAVTSDINDFNYYSMLSCLAIGLGDVARIKAVLTKLKSLSVA